METVTDLEDIAIKEESVDVPPPSIKEEAPAEVKEEPIVVQPKETLYISNLNEKIKIDELKKALYALFSQYGTVLDIVACKTYKLRGQAWIIFDTTAQASAACNKLSGSNFFDKPLKVNFAKEKSDPIVEREGQRVDKEKRKVEKRKRKEREDEEREKKRKVFRHPHNKNADPNKLLLVQNIPNLDAVIAHDMLRTLFSQYEGLKDVRMVPGKGVAFVEFENEIQSSRAMEGLQNFKITPDYPLAVSFAK